MTPLNKHWDITVIGAGPAGSTAAFQLAKKGYSVLIVDKDPFPRDKICGDGLIPDSINYLKKLNLYDKVQDKAFSTPSIDIYSSTLKHIRLNSDFMVIKRYDLDHILLKNAIDAGATFAVTNVRHIDDTQKHLILHTKSDPIHTNYAIIATGANLGLRRNLNKDPLIKPDGVAIRGYFKSTTSIDALTFQITKAPSPL